jgi:hypothetical protein
VKYAIKKNKGIKRNKVERGKKRIRRRNKKNIKQI